MIEIISSNIVELQKLLEMHKIKRAYVFGSAVSGYFSEKSDIDLLVKFDENISPLEKGELWWDLHDKLRKLLNREIDMVTENSLKNPYFIKEIDRTKQLIYGQ